MKLTIVINELVINARKHAYGNHAAGRLEVDCVSDEKGLLHLNITDDGPGMPTGFSLGKAAGLGLSIVRSTVEQLGGHIVVENNHGACFKITVPVGSPAAMIQ